jgi:hypothetical protein
MVAKHKAAQLRVATEKGNLSAEEQRNAIVLMFFQDADVQRYVGLLHHVGIDVADGMDMLDLILSRYRDAQGNYDPHAPQMMFTATASRTARIGKVSLAVATHINGAEK